MQIVHAVSLGGLSLNRSFQLAERVFNGMRRRNCLEVMLKVGRPVRSAGIRLLRTIIS
jgi:pentatricopeptide repeat protein